VWFVTELFYPEERSTGYFLTRIAEALVTSFSVRVLCSQPTYDARGVRGPRQETHNGVWIHRCSGTAYPKDSLIGRALNLVTWCSAVFVRAISEVRSGDTVFAVTNPPLLPFVIAVACRLRGAKCVLIVHDVYPEVMIATGFITATSLLGRLAGWATAKLYGEVTRIVVLGEDMKRLVVEKANGRHAPIAIIPNWADTHDIFPLRRLDNSLLARLNIERQFVVQYSGNIGRTHGIDDILECAKRMQEDEGVHFLFIGSGAKTTAITRAIEASDRHNMTLLPYQPRSYLNTSLNACDVALVSMVPGMSGVSVPSRMYNVLSAGKPLIGVVSRDSELATIILREDVGWVVEPGDVEALAEAIRTAQANPLLLGEMAVRARRAAEEKFTFQKIQKLYIQLVNDVGGYGHAIRSTTS
jgi:glycosyltransferase involved in cell wall biosynthesis